MWGQGRPIAVVFLGAWSALAPFVYPHAVKGRVAAPWPAALREDADLHAVYFVDREHGWAVGDRGAIWHSVDGGTMWQLQSAPTRASLEDVCFLDDQIGWAVGGRTKPYTHGGSGVTLQTTDAGVTWTRIGDDLLPSLTRVHFFSPTRGVVTGHSSALFPSGIFHTTDGGRSWIPLAVQSDGGWEASAFLAADTGIAVSARGRICRGMSGRWQTKANARPAMPRMHDIAWSGTQQAAIAGDRGTLMVTEDGGDHWTTHADRLPPGIRDQFDFLTVCARDGHLWLAGSPGSTVLHSGDGGLHWNVHRTGQTLPIEDMMFVDEGYGWAVTAMGSILATRDGGATWQVQRGDQRRLAILGVFGRAKEVPLELFAKFGGADGYRTRAVVCEDELPRGAKRFAPPQRKRLHEAVVTVGGGGADTCWQFPISAFHGEAGTTCVRRWTGIHVREQLRYIGRDELVNQLVRAIRSWRPDTLIISPATDSESLSAVVRDATLRAVALAGNPKILPDQQLVAGLGPWQPRSVLAGGGAASSRAASRIALAELALPLGMSLADLTLSGQGLLRTRPEIPPAAVSLQPLDGAPGEQSGREFRSAFAAAPGSPTRRAAAAAAPGNLAHLRRMAHRQQNLQALLQRGGASPHGAAWVAQLENLTRDLDGDTSARALFQLASLQFEAGRIALATATLQQLIDRHPQHETRDAAFVEQLRWRLSSEARHWQRRQAAPTGSRREGATARPRVVEHRSEATGSAAATAVSSATAEFAAYGSMGGVQPATSGQPIQRSGPDAGEKRAQPALSGWSNHRVITASKDSPSVSPPDNNSSPDPELLKQLVQQAGPLITADPAIQFALAADRRLHFRSADQCRGLYQRLLRTSPAGDWQDCAITELWLLGDRRSTRKSICRCDAAPRPLLDGRLEEAAWTKARAVSMDVSSGGSGGSDETAIPLAELRLAYSPRYLFVGISCERVSDVRYAPPTRPRPRDAELSAYDHVEFVLDTDRDYNSDVRFAVDQRGWTWERALGSVSWNPTWYVASRLTDTQWCVEAAIPFEELTDAPPASGDTWLLGACRVQPRRGCQRWPTDAAPGLPLQSVGLLSFK